MISLVPLVLPALASAKNIASLWPLAYDELRPDLTALLKEESPARMRAILDRACLEFALFNHRTWGSGNTLSRQAPLEAIGEVSRTLREKGKRALTRRAYEAIGGALDSLEGLLTSLGETERDGQDERVVPLLASFCSVQKAALAILTAYVGLEGQFLVPSKRTLSLLCFAADRHMADVEDNFLALSAHAVRAKEEPTVSVWADALRSP